MNKLKNNNKELFYKVVEKNTKHSYIKPKNGYVLITKSKNMSLDIIVNELKENFEHYYTSSKEIKEDILYLWGKPYELVVKESPSFSYLLKKNQIIVNSKKTSILKVKEKILKNELKNFLLKIKNEVNLKLEEQNYYQVPIKLKLLKSKFGSYNINKNNEYIVLNVFLASLEEEYTLYVLYHEYAHQKVKNHKPEFYRTLGKLYKEHHKYNKKLQEKRLII